ncbi:hypothetical protein [Haloprofundus salinisoli]|uniref:hypothetical protein n=1 Tax=Haloprofundus salinisoli TaxID=2876193 RepID=UPI001CCDE0D5|nr:hypothetical protein [Haloprofundus salinisoli]
MDLANYADEIGPGLVIVAGLILFLIPEPATSALGIGLMLFGLAYWFYEWGRP